MKSEFAVTLALTASHCLGAALTQAAGAGFDRYVIDVEARLARQHASAGTYIAMLDRGAVSGAIQVEPVNGGVQGLRGALLHHWRGVTLVPQASPKDMLGLLRDYDHFSQIYSPEIVSTRVLSDDGENVHLGVRLKEQRVITIVFDAEYSVRARLDGEDRGYSVSRSTGIWQVDSPGAARERRRAYGQDDGFLWRLNSYWSFVRVPGGLRIECEAVSLTRDVPAGLGWLITPFLQDLPREALEFTLGATRRALMVRATSKGSR